MRTWLAARLRQVVDWLEPRMKVDGSQAAQELQAAVDRINALDHMVRHIDGNFIFGFWQCGNCGWRAESKAEWDAGPCADGCKVGEPR